MGVWGVGRGMDRVWSYFLSQENSASCIYLNSVSLLLSGQLLHALLCRVREPPLSSIPGIPLGAAYSEVQNYTSPGLWWCFFYKCKPEAFKWMFYFKYHSLSFSFLYFYSLQYRLRPSGLISSYNFFFFKSYKCV